MRQRTGLRTSHHVVRRHSAGGHVVFSRHLPEITYSTVFAHQLAASGGYSRPSALGFMPHRDPFGPDATPTVGLRRFIPSNRHPYQATPRCGRPTGFRVPPLLPGFSEPITSPFCVSKIGSPASGLVRDCFDVARILVGLRPSVSHSPSASHQPAYAHLSERCLARIDYSCRHGSPTCSKARGATPDFVHPPFTRPRLPPRLLLG